MRLAKHKHDDIHPDVSRDLAIFLINDYVNIKMLKEREGGKLSEPIVLSFQAAATPNPGSTRDSGLGAKAANYLVTRRTIPLELPQLSSCSSICYSTPKSCTDRCLCIAFPSLTFGSLPDGCGFRAQEVTSTSHLPAATPPRTSS